MVLGETDVDTCVLGDHAVILRARCKCIQPTEGAFCRCAVIWGMHSEYEQSLHETILIAGIISHTSDIEMKRRVRTNYERFCNSRTRRIKTI